MVVEKIYGRDIVVYRILRIDAGGPDGSGGPSEEKINMSGQEVIRAAWT